MARDPQWGRSATSTEVGQTRPPRPDPRDLPGASDAPPESGRGRGGNTDDHCTINGHAECLMNKAGGVSKFTERPLHAALCGKERNPAITVRIEKSRSRRQIWAKPVHWVAAR